MANRVLSSRNASAGPLLADDLHQPGPRVRADGIEGLFQALTAPLFEDDAGGGEIFDHAGRSLADLYSTRRNTACTCGTRRVARFLCAPGADALRSEASDTSVGYLELLMGHCKRRPGG